MASSSGPSLRHPEQHGYTLDPAPADAPARRQWFALAVLSAGLGLIVLDGTIVGVALPNIISDLHLDLDLTDAQWVNSLYAMLLAALLLSTGKPDRSGRRPSALRSRLPRSVRASGMHTMMPHQTNCGSQDGP